MRYFIVMLCVLCLAESALACQYCVEHPGEKEMMTQDTIELQTKDGQLVDKYSRERDLILLRRINALDKTIPKRKKEIAAKGG